MFCLRRALAQFLASTPSFSFVPSESIYEQTRVHGALRQSPGEQRRHTPLHRERERESRETSAQRHLDGTCAHAHARARAPCIAPLRHGSRNASVHACAPLDGRQVALQGRAATRTVCNSTNAPPLTPLRMVDLHEPRRACALATAYPRHAHMRARPNLPATCLSAATRGGTHPLSLSSLSFILSIIPSLPPIALLFFFFLTLLFYPPLLARLSRAALFMHLRDHRSRG